MFRNLLYIRSLVRIGQNISKKPEILNKLSVGPISNIYHQNNYSSYDWFKNAYLTGDPKKDKELRLLQTKVRKEIIYNIRGM